METIYFKGTPCHTYGNLPAVGEKAPCFTLVTPELKEIHCNDFPGKYIVLNIFPSLDLPFAAQRFCSAEGIKDVIPASAFRSPVFVQKYGVQLVDGPLSGLLARAVLIIDKDMNIIYRELVDEITHEPDYDAALKMLK